MNEGTEMDNLPVEERPFQDAPPGEAQTQPANAGLRGTNEPASKNPSGTDRWTRVICALLLVVVIVVGVFWYVDNSNLHNRISGLSSQLTSTNAALATTQAQLDTARQEALHPTLGTWNLRSSIAPNSWLAGSVPDTFTFHLRFTADADVYFAFLTLAEYVRFNECPSNVYALDSSVNRLSAGCVNYWIFGNSAPKDRVGVSTAGANAGFDFHQAEGCASWVLVLMPQKAGVTVIISPQVAVTYNPASKPTPPCA